MTVGGERRWALSSSKSVCVDDSTGRSKPAAREQLLVTDGRLCRTVRWSYTAGFEGMSILLIAHKRPSLMVRTPGRRQSPPSSSRRPPSFTHGDRASSDGRRRIREKHTDTVTRWQNLGKRARTVVSGSAAPTGASKASGGLCGSLVKKSDGLSPIASRLWACDVSEAWAQ
jgi:hypothetical protein